MEISVSRIILSLPGLYGTMQLTFESRNVFLGCRVYVTAVLLSQCMVFKKLSRQYVKHVVKPQPTAGRQYVPFGLPFLS